MLWSKRRAPQTALLGQTLGEVGLNSVAEEVADLLSCIDAEYILVNGSDQVVLTSDGIATFNVLRDGVIRNEHLRLMVRATRTSQMRQEATIELPRGPVGAGMHDLLVRVSLIGENGVIAILIFDDSEMRRLDAIRRDFVANVSHELKTPIGALSILSEAVQEAADDQAAVAKFAARMQSEAKRLSDLVQEIINLSRLQDGDPLKDGKVFGLRGAIEEAIDQTQLSAEQKNIKIIFNFQFDFGDDVSMIGRADQIIMAVHNLVENAVNYSPENTRVVVSLRQKDDLIEISVSDQGIGIPEKDLERIFERFYRVDAARSRETGGTGLGLSIVKHVASNHGGDVSVWSVEGAGSTFTIRLPKVNQRNAEEQ